MELENKFEVIPIIVTICKKNHKLLGKDVLNINSTKLINEIKMEKTGKLKNYKASLKLKENVTPSYYEAWKLPVHWVETDVLSLDRMAAETRHDPVLSSVTSRVRKTWGNCSWVERPYKEIRHKLTIEQGVICNGDLLIPPETQRKLVIKSVNYDIHCGVAATQKRIKLEAWWPRYSRDVKEYIKRCKNVKN